MKLTKENFQEKWPLVSDKLPEAITSRYDMAVNWAKGYAENQDQRFLNSLNFWLNTINSMIADVKEPEEKKSEPQKETEKKESKAKEVKEKKDSKKEDAPKEKDSKKPKTSNRPHKDSYARAPYWYKILEGFLGLAGKNKETWRIQNYLDYIQDTCASERKRNTPFIEIIREIQDCILKYANVDRKEKPKQTLPAWADLVKKCKDAMKTITISAKTGASPFWSKAGLAGFGIQKWYIAFMDTRGFSKLDDAKKYIRQLSATDRKHLAAEKSYIYRTTDNKMDRTVDFKCYGKTATARFGKVKACK